MATNTTTILQATSPTVVPVTAGFFVEFAGTQDGGRTFNIEAGAGAEGLDPGVTVNLSEASTDYSSIERDGSLLRIIDSNGNVAAEIAADPTVTSTVSFTNGSTEIAVVGTEITFGGISFADGEAIDPNVTPLDLGGSEFTIAAPTPNAVDEGDTGETSTLEFTVTRSGSTDGTASVNFAVTGSGSDPADAADFSGGVLPTGTVNFADGETTQTVTIEILGDIDVEADEGFTVTLDSPSGANTIGAPASADGVITNDDAPFTLTESADAVNEGDTVTYTVTLPAPATADTTVTFTVSPGNATALDQGTDTTNLNDFAAGTFNPITDTIVAGSDTATFNVSGKVDGLTELPETFSVTVELGGFSATEETTLLDGSAAGQIFTLTTGTDVLPGLTGSNGDASTAGDDTVVGENGTLTANDNLDGGTGDNVLDYSSSGSANVTEQGFETNNIQTFEITSDVDSGKTTTFELTDANGVTSLVNDDSSADLVLEGLEAITAITLREVTGGNTTVTYQDSVLAGSSDEQSLTLNGVASQTDTAVSTVIIGKASDVDGGVETINLVTTGAASLLTELDTGASTINISGDKDLFIENELVGATTINADGFDGDLQLKADTGEAVAFTGGSGNDRIDFGGSFNSNDTITGGDGTADVLGVNTLSSIDNADTVSADGFEVLAFTDATGGTLDVNSTGGSAAVLPTSINTFEFEGGLSSALTLTDTQNDVTVNLAGDPGGNSVTVALVSPDTTADTVNIGWADDVDGTISTLTANDAETLNLDVDETASDKTLTINTLTAEELTTLNITGDGNLNIASAGTATLTTIDASTATGDLDIDGLAGAYKASTAVTITTGEGDDSVAGSAFSDTLSLGDGDDTLAAGDGNDTVTAGDGNDSIDGGNGADSIDGGEGNDTIDGGVNGDTLTGGTGSDVFVYDVLNDSRNTTGPDTISDFLSGTDRFDISGLQGNATTTAAGGITGFTYVGEFGSFADASGAVTDASGLLQAVLDTSTNILYFDLNDDGTLNNNDVAVILTGVVDLDAADFIDATVPGATITLTAANASVSTTDDTNATDTTTEGDDTIQSTTAFLSGSTIDAAGGADTLTVTDNAAGTITSLQAGPTLTDVEAVIFNDTTGVVSIGTNNNGEDITVNGANGGLTVEVTQNDQDFTVTNTTPGGNGSTITLADKTDLDVTLGSSDDTVDKLQTDDADISTGAGDDTVKIDDGSVADRLAAFEGATVDGGAGTGDTLEYDTDAAGARTNTLSSDITNFETLTVDDTNATGTQTYTLSAANGIETINSTIGTQDAIFNVPGTDLTFTGSSAKDETINFSSAGTFTLAVGTDTNEVTLANGTNTVSITAGDLAALGDTAGETFVGGTGTDTIVLTDNATGAELGAAEGQGVSAVETVKLDGGGDQVLTTVDSNVASGETLTIDNDGTGNLTFDGSAETDGSFVINNADSTTAGSVITGGSKADTITLSTGAAAEQVNINGDGTAAAASDIDNFDVIENFNFNEDLFGINGAGASVTNYTVATADDANLVSQIQTQINTDTAGFNGVNEIAFITVSAGSAAGTYIAVNSGTDSNLTNDDLFVELVNITGAPSPSDFVGAGITFTANAAPFDTSNSATSVEATVTGANDDTINATGTQASDAGTVIDGVSGNDTLNITDNTGLADISAATVSNIDVINLQAGSTGLVTMPDLAGLTVNNTTAAAAEVALGDDGGGQTYVGNSDVDTVTSGTGPDTITLGAGNDVFTYNSGDGFDTVTDFTAGGTDDGFNLDGFTLDSGDNATATIADGSIGAATVVAVGDANPANVVSADTANAIFSFEGPNQQLAIDFAASTSAAIVAAVESMLAGNNFNSGASPLAEVATPAGNNGQIFIVYEQAAQGATRDAVILNAVGDGTDDAYDGELTVLALFEGVDVSTQQLVGDDFL